MKPIRKNCADPGRIPLVQRFDALAIADGSGASWKPGSVLVDRRGGAVILAVGSPGEVDHHPAATGALCLPLPNSVVFPGLVNAHTHLDLTHLGPRPYEPGGGFVGWVDMVRTGRLETDDEIAGSVRRGIALSRTGGTVAVGDIAGGPKGRASLAPLRELAAAGMRGVSFLEFFGIGGSDAATREWLTQRLEEAHDHESEGLRVGLQPHAPNTVAPSMYEWAARLGRERGIPLCTHLAETPEEREFISSASGTQRHLLERLGVWKDSILEHIGHGRHPVAHLSGILGEGHFLVAHVNDADDAAIETLARTGTAVAYCPRASAYFGAQRHFGPHRYREMIAAGINVALGTDSIVNLPPAAASQGMSILDEMRFLSHRDAVDPVVLLRMATLNGAAALGLDQSLFVLAPGNVSAGLVAVEVETGSGTPLYRVMASETRPYLLFPEK